MKDLFLNESAYMDIRAMIEMKKKIDDLDLIHHQNSAVRSFIMMIDNEFNSEMGLLAKNLFVKKSS